MRPLLALVLLVGVAHADSVPATIETPSMFELAPLRLPPLELARLGTLNAQRHTALVHRNIGIALTVAGTLMTVFGSLGVCLGDADCHGIYGNTSWSSELASMAVTIAGQALITPGIVLWAKGQTDADRAEQKAVSLNAGGLRVTF